MYVQRGFIWGLRISLSALFKSDSNYFNVFYGIIVFHNKDFIYIYIVFFSVFVFAKKILLRRFFFLMAGVKEISAKASPTELRSSRVL